jgi:hypothetical protein
MGCFQTANGAEMDSTRNWELLCRVQGGAFRFATGDQRGIRTGIPSTFKTLAQRTGLSEEELTKQLSHVLPGVVDKLTPAGRVPTAAELSNLR